MAVWEVPEPPWSAKPRIEVVCAEDDGDVGVDAALYDAHQVVEQSLGDVFDVRGTGAHVSVVHGGEHGGEGVAGGADRVFGVALLGLEAVVDAYDIVVIVEEHGVGLEDERGVVAGFRTALLRKFHQLSGGFLFRFGDARLLGFNVLAGFFYDGGVGFLQEVERALRNAFRNAFSL